MFVPKKNIRYFYYKILEKIRNFLLSDKSREFLIFLFFFLVAAAFWLLQTLNNDYQAEFSIPLKLKKVPNNVVLTSPLPSELKIQVKDKGTVLLNYLWGQNFHPIVLDFENYSHRGNHVVISPSELEKKTVDQLESSSKLSVIKPDTIDFIYTKGQARKIPVLLSGNISVGRQYYVADTLLSPDSVVVYAPRSILDTIKKVYTQKVELENITDTVRRKVSLSPIRGAKFIPDVVDVTLSVDMFTEKTLEVPIIGINFPPDKILRTFPSKVKVTFQIGLSKFRKIRADDFIVVVSYEELAAGKSDKYKVQLKAYPAGVSHIRISPEEVDFLIEQVPAYEH